MARKNTIEIIIKATDKAGKVLGKIAGVVKGLGKAALIGLGALGAAGAVAGAAILKLGIDAAPLVGIRKAFEGIAESSGESADKMLAALQKGSAGMITQRDLMAKYNLAAQLVGTTFANQLPNAMGYLSKVAAATGEDMGYMMDSMVRGVGRLSPMILDNLGIQVNLAEANEAYALELGKTVEELSKAEQQTALMNQVMLKLEENTAAMPDVVGTAATELAGFTTKIKDLKDGIGVGLQPVLLALLVPLNDLITKYGPRIIEWAEEAGKWLGEMVPAAIDWLGETWEKWWPIISSEILSAWDIIKPKLEMLGKWLKETLPAAVKRLKALWAEFWPVAQEKVMGFWNTIKPALEWLKIQLMNFYEEILPRLRSAWDILKEGWDEIVSAYNTQLKPALGELLAALQPLWDKLGIGETAFSDAGAQLGAFAGFMTRLLASGAVEQIKGAINFLAAAIRLLVRAFELGVHWGVRIRDVINSMFGVFDAIRDRVYRVKDAFQRFKDALAGFHLPGWLTPGSPTPLETGLVGIEEVLARVQRLASGGLNFGGSPLAMAGGGGIRGGGSLGGGGQAISIVNNFGRGSVRSDEDVLEIADAITQNLELRGVTPML